MAQIKSERRTAVRPSMHQNLSKLSNAKLRQQLKRGTPAAKRMAYGILVQRGNR